MCDRIFKMKRLKVFLSYSSKDRVIAGGYKSYLEAYYGFQVFVAHDDNTPSTKWSESIQENLKSSDVFVVLISKDSKESQFVNQEIGVALGLEKKIFPIKIDQTNPFGFIHEIHGFPHVKTDDQILINGSKLFSILSSDKKQFSEFNDITAKSLIYALSKSHNWEQSNMIIATLLELEKQSIFSTENTKLIKQSCNQNYEVYGGAFAYDRLKKLLQDKYGVKGLL